MKKLVALFFLLVSPAWGQTSQTFLQYMNALPSAASPLLGTESTYIIQSGVSKKAPFGTNASLAPMLANTVKCNPTGSQATPQDCTSPILSGSILSNSASGGVGYNTGQGAGGAVTQVTSRTTGVTLNKITGAITLFSAAGSTAATTFTVTNSSVAAADTVIINQASGTNLYEIFVTAVVAGSFNVTFLTTGGTATDAPVFNFSVIKGSAN